MSELMADKPRKLGAVKQSIVDIVLGAQRLGASDLTAKEIQGIYEERVKHGRMSDGYFAGRVSELVADGYLLHASKRQCRATLSTSVNAVYAPSAVAAISAASADFY